MCYLRSNGYVDYIFEGGTGSLIIFLMKLAVGKRMSKTCFVTVLITLYITYKLI